MRVNDRNLAGATPAETGRAQETENLNRGQAARTGTAAAGKTGDSVQLSSTVESLWRAMSVSGSDRAQRVQTLAAQYQNGSYQPDSAATAHGMVSEALLAEGQ